MSASGKGEELEEVVREYFSRQGFFVLRSVKLRFEDEDITDVDVWSYGRQSANLRTRTIIDVKNKQRPKAAERILWARGMQLALGCDRAVVATTDGSDKAKRFAAKQNVSLLTKAILDRLQLKIAASGRLTWEQFSDVIAAYTEHKNDGDWLQKLADAKAAVISLPSYPAFNKAIEVFCFFARRAETRQQHHEQALRAAYFSASIACIALDAAIAVVVYEEASSRHAALINGITYGDSGDGSTRRSVDQVLAVIAESMENGRVIASRARDQFNRLFESIRADVIAEFFAKEHNASSLFNVAKELELRAFSADPAQLNALSVEAKATLGVFADFVGVKRAPLIGSGSKSLDQVAVRDRSDPGLKGDSLTVGSGMPEDSESASEIRLL